MAYNTPMKPIAKKAAVTTKHPWSWRGILNILVLQFFFVRLAAQLNERSQVTKLRLIGMIVPLTGWWSDYIYLKRPARRVKDGKIIWISWIIRPVIKEY